LGNLWLFNLVATVWLFSKIHTITWTLELALDLVALLGPSSMCWFKGTPSPRVDIDEGQSDEMSKSKKVEEMFHVLRKQQDGLSYCKLDLSYKTYKFLTLVS